MKYAIKCPVTEKIGILTPIEALGLKPVILLPHPALIRGFEPILVFNYYAMST